MSTSPITARKGFTFGCDPELFVFDSKDRPVPADMIPGTKAEPFKVPKGAVQRDGMAAEFNIDPVTTFEEFNDSILTVMSELKKFLPRGYSLKTVPFVRFDPEIFDRAPDEAKELGCMPDFNAWTGEINPPPADPEDPFLRTASGHLHIGWTEDEAPGDPQHVMNCRDLVKQLDWYLGTWSTLKDKDTTRRKLYGKAGACRFKDYGVEYRVLSNFWLSTKANRLQVWNRMCTAIALMKNKFMPDKAGPAHSDIIVQGINQSEISHSFIEFYNFPIQTMDLNLSRV